MWLGFWGTGLHNAFAYVGLQYTTATNGVILNSSVPVMIIVLAWAVYRETITRVQALGVGISLVGILAEHYGQRAERYRAAAQGLESRCFGDRRVRVMTASFADVATRPGEVCAGPG